MVAGRHKSGTFRKVHRKTPGGKTIVQFKRRKPGKAKCASCGKVLPGTARKLPYKMKKMAKTKKRPERPYGGILCSGCMRKKIIENIK